MTSSTEPPGVSVSSCLGYRILGDTVEVGALQKGTGLRYPKKNRQYSYPVEECLVDYQSTKGQGKGVPVTDSGELSDREEASRVSPTHQVSPPLYS